MHKSAVSVLIPLYNHERYISEAIESVLAQTFDDFECIVLDDGSTDASLAIAREYEKRDSRVRVFSQSNAGLVRALNVLAEKAAGKYVTTLDADDAFFPDRLKSGVARLDAEHRLAVSFCSTKVIDAEGNASGMRAELVKGPLHGHDFLERLVVSNLVASCAGLMRADCLRKTKPFAREFAQVPDWDLWLRMSAHGLLELSEDVQVKVRWDGSNMSSKNIALSYQQHYAVSKQVSEIVVEREGLQENVRRRVYRARANWAMSIGDFLSASREFLLLSKLSPLSFEEAVYFSTCLISLGKLALAERVLLQVRLQDGSHISKTEKTIIKKKIDEISTIQSLQKPFQIISTQPNEL